MDKKSIKKYWRILTVGLLALTFFLGASSFNYFTQNKNFVKWLSPDENANYVFSKLYAQEHKLTIYEGYNLYSGGIMYPRSFRSDNGYIKPVSFLGLILIYGQIARWTSVDILPYLTPLFGALGLVFFYLLISNIFGRRNGIISAFLLAFFPPYIYYSARSMFHNILFISLLIIGLYFISALIKKSKIQKMSKNIQTAGITNKFINYFPGYKNALLSALGGAFLGLAIITRTSELIWLGPLLVLLWLFNIKKIGLVNLMVITSFLAAAFIPVFYWNQVLYGAPTASGYPQMTESINNIASAGTDLVKPKNIFRPNNFQLILKKISSNIFQFGIKPRESFTKFFNYSARMFYWLFWPTVAGFLFLFVKIYKLKRVYILYMISFLLASVFLIIYYGSWNFHDNPDPRSITIGNSYTRYWLPIYLAAIPFISLIIIKASRLALVARRILNKQPYNTYNSSVDRWRVIFKRISMDSIKIVFILILSLLSLYNVLFAREEGLLESYQKQINTQKLYFAVLNLTEKNSTIITRYYDKLFFPERKVIVGLFDDDNMIRQYAKLVNYIPVYYFNFTLPPKDFNYLNDRRLKQFGIGLVKVKSVEGGFTLYRVVNQK
jgi:4-amino-4-deoxy-L-arabinose transferase-like glycosyltransferase